MGRISIALHCSTLKPKPSHSLPLIRKVSMDRGSAPVFFMLNVRFTVKLGGLLALGDVS